MDDIVYFDLYSCFLIVVYEVCEIFGIVKDDLCLFIVIGGLFYFGGLGNNYFMYVIVSMVECLCVDGGSYGLVLVNGGWMLKFVVGIYFIIVLVEWVF